MGEKDTRGRRRIVIVADSGPIIHLSQADLLYLLSNMGSVVVPPAVAREVEGVLETSEWQNHAEIRQLGEEDLKLVREWMISAGLHEGEAEAICLAGIESSSLLVTDAAAARVFAGMHGLEVRGSLGIVLWNAVKRHISGDSARVALTTLRETSIWVSDVVFSEATSLLDELS